MFATPTSSPIRSLRFGVTTRSAGASSRMSRNRRCAPIWPTIAVIGTASSGIPPNCLSTSARTSMRCTPNSARFESDSASRSRTDRDVVTAHQRLSVHNVTFYGESLADLETHWAGLGVSRLRILDNQLRDPEFPMLLHLNDSTAEAVTHVFAGGGLGSDPQAAREGLSTVIDAA